MVTLKDSLEDGDRRKRRAVEALTRELGTIRAGRANPALVEGVMVDYYGTATPLNQLASITTPEARLLVVQPWDRQSLPAVEKAILKSGLGLNPISDGIVIRLALPQLTEERRRELVRQVHKKVEEARVEVRNIRRDVLEQLRSMEKNKDISQDEAKRAQEQLQKMTELYIAQMDALAAGKEREVLEV
ncbi:MAG: ribosome recycling factor [Dehalococcoidia bacterium]|nr:ribosome recycling factor [Dehalococcoidia bacterium]